MSACFRDAHLLSQRAKRRLDFKPVVKKINQTIGYQTSRWSRLLPGAYASHAVGKT
jgi:hypothetical protein